MNTKKFLLGGVLILMSAVVLLFMFGVNSKKDGGDNAGIVDNIKPVDVLPSSTKNLSFTISGETIVLKDGIAEIPTAPGSATVRTVTYFGNEVEQDIDGDGDLDKVFLVIDNPGGTGTFFYAVGAINDDEHYSGTNAMFLGDRIAPQTTETANNGEVIINYAERLPAEPMTTPPSVGKSMWLKYDVESNSFGEVVQDFEGESVSNAKEKINLIRVSEPTEGSTVGSPFLVSGEARGYWFFEASFPITVVNWDGLIIGQGYATADGDWMTEEFVPFSGTIEYNLPPDTPYKHGSIIFHKDNPSGLPEHDDAMEMPVMLE